MKRTLCSPPLIYFSDGHYLCQHLYLKVHFIDQAPNSCVHLYYRSNIFIMLCALKLHVPFLLTGTHLFSLCMHYYPLRVPLIFFLVHATTSLTVVHSNYVKLCKILPDSTHPKEIKSQHNTPHDGSFYPPNQISSHTQNLDRGTNFTTIALIVTSPATILMFGVVRLVVMKE